MKSLVRLRDLGFAPKAILDVGAFVGNFSRMARKHFPEAHIMMIDALPEVEPYLATAAEEIGNAEFAIALAGARNGPATFYVVDSEARPDVCKTGSSIYREKSEYPMIARAVTQAPLSETLAGKEPFQLVKLDVQGAELDVLAGYGDMSGVHAILLEMSLVEYNAGAPLIDAVLARVREYGFVLFDIDETHHRDRRGTLLQLDGLFLREDARVRPRGPFWK